MPNHHTITHIVAAVSQAGPAGISAEEVAGATGLGLEAVCAALRLQIEANLMSSKEIWNGELYVRHYKMDKTPAA